MKIQDVLMEYDAAVIKQLARDHKVDVKNFGKEQVANALAKYFAQPAHVTNALTQLKPADRVALDYLQLAGGTAAVGALKHMLLQDHIIVPTPQKKNAYSYSSQPYIGNPAYTGKPAFEDVAVRLLKLGLAFGQGVPPGTRQMLGLEGGRYLVLPSVILDQLPPVETEQETIAAPIHTVPGSARNLQRDLSRYWSFVRRNGKLELTAPGWLLKKSVTGIAALLGLPPNKKRDEKTDLYLFFLRRLLMDLDLLRAEATGWDAYTSQTWVADKEAFWSMSPQERTRAAFEAWRDGDSWNELRIPAASYGTDQRKPAPAELAAARKLILEHLKVQGAGNWIGLEALRNDVRLKHYEFLFPRHRMVYYDYYPTVESTPYFQRNNPYMITYKDIQDEASGWDIVEGAIITHMVTGPLFWLGLVDLGSEKANTPATSFRLNETGAWLLGLQDSVTQTSESGRLVVQPNFQIVAMEPIDDSVLMSLDAFAHFEGGEHALVYRLSRESLYRGQQNGWSAERVIAFLEGLARGNDATRIPLPQNVVRSIQEWQTQHERITIRRKVPLLQADNPATLDALFVPGDETAAWGKRVAPQIALPRSDAQTTIGALRDAGLFPLVTWAGQTDAPLSVTADEEGNVEFFGSAPSIYAYGAVEAFTEQGDAQHAQLTPASVRTAVDADISVPEILTRLQHVHRGPLPPKLVQRIKAWGKFYGDARVGALTLLEFRDEGARQELLADPELAPFIEGFDAGTRPLVLVREQALERVRELLQERGVELREFQTKSKKK